MRSILRRIRRDQGGATAIEYGLIAALIAVAIVGSLETVRDNLSAKFTAVSNELAK